MSTSDRLFASGDLSGALRAQESEMDAAAQSIPADHALARSVEELAAELVERFRVEPLAIDWEAMTVSHNEARVDVSQRWDRGVSDRSRPLYIPGTTVTYHVPFTGEADLFKTQPSTMTTVWPFGEVSNGELRVSATAPIPVPESLKGQLDNEVAQVKKYVGWVNQDVGSFNTKLEGSARAAAQARREKVLRDRELIASFGLPVRRREDATPTYAAPPARRRATRPPAPLGRIARLPEPILPAEEYEHILSVVRNMVSVMERSPKAFVGMGEEDLRQHFLVQLNGQYEGKATGETFNFEGKTDILVREGDRNLFIAECKFWNGPKQLSATIDQILGYTSWRDTKTAIFVFNRRRELSRVLSQIAPTVTAHDTFVREIPYRDETSFRFVLHHRDDPERELTLTILVFEVPS